MPLKPFQTAAIDHIRRYAQGRREWARARITDILAMSNVQPSKLDHALGALRKNTRVGIHFHPDRLDSNSRLVVESLLHDGVYKSQFATFISNGKVAPEHGGSRDRWENRLFGDFYAGTDVRGSDRPKYAGLDLMRSPDGPCPRFGSCYLLLKPTVLARCTFSYRDSFLDTVERGTLDCLDDIIAALLADSFEREFVLGRYGMRPDSLVDFIIENSSRPLTDRVGDQPSRNLDFYIEAQVHGDVSLESDVDALVADSAFQSTAIGDTLTKMAERFSIELIWYRGFSLQVEKVPENFRGPSMPSLAARVAPGKLITSKLIGDAARNAVSNPSNWTDRGTQEQVLQELKLLWHVVVKYGAWGK